MTGWILMMALSAGLAKDVKVKGYYRANGTYVESHYRSAPNGTEADNWSTVGNVNPHTGEEGTRQPTSRTAALGYMPHAPSTGAQANAHRDATYPGVWVCDYGFRQNDGLCHVGPAASHAATAVVLEETAIVTCGDALAGICVGQAAKAYVDTGKLVNCHTGDGGSLHMARVANVSSYLHAATCRGVITEVTVSTLPGSGESAIFTASLAYDMWRDALVADGWLQTTEFFDDVAVSVVSSYLRTTGDSVYTRTLYFGADGPYNQTVTRLSTAAPPACTEGL